MVFQLLIPLGQSLSVDASADGNRDETAPLILCELMGGTTKDPAKNGPSDPSGPYTSCPICQIRSLGENLMVAQQAALPTRQTALTSKPEALVDQKAAGLTPTGKHPRAPPLFV